MKYVAYEQLTDFAKNVIPEEEFNSVVDRVYNVLYDYSDWEETGSGFDQSCVAKNIALWVENKAVKIAHIKAHKDYDSQYPYKIVKKSQPFTREKNEEEVKRFANRCQRIVTESYYADNSFIKTVINEFKETNIMPSDVDAYKSFLNAFCFEEREPEEVKRLGGITKEQKEKLTKNCMPHVNQKTNKFVRKLLIQLGVDFTQNAMESEFAKYSDAMCPITYTRDYVVSVDPVDYLLMSHGHNWTSCYTINFYWNGQDYEGQCSGGVWSYMTDKFTFITYVPFNGEHNESTLEYAEREKIYRQCMMFNDENMLFHSRLYPQENDNGADNTYKEMRMYGQTVVSELYGHDNYWHSKKFNRITNYEEGSIYNDLVDMSDDFIGYSDPSYFPTTLSLLPETKTKMETDSSYKPVKIRYGGKSFCPSCGDKLSKYGDDRYRCESCLGHGMKCYNCGNRIDTNYDSYSVDSWGNYYCEECSTYCEYHNQLEPERNTEFYYVRYPSGREYGYVCEDAIESGDFFYCENCGEWYYRNGDEKIDPDDNEICDRCFDNNCRICDECGTVVWESNGEDLDGEFLCDDCIERREAETEEMEDTMSESAN